RQAESAPRSGHRSASPGLRWSFSVLFVGRPLSPGPGVDLPDAFESSGELLLEASVRWFVVSSAFQVVGKVLLADDTALVIVCVPVPCAVTRLLHELRGR